MPSSFRPTLVFVAFISGVAALGCGTSSKNNADSGAGGGGSAGQSGVGGTGPSGTGGQQATGGHSADAGPPGVGGMTGVGGKSGQGGAAPDAAADAKPGTGGRVDAGDAGRDVSNDADGGAPFAPCPTNGGACVILPLGDSITDGFPFENGGYRVELFSRTLLASKHVTFVGSQSNGPATVSGVAFPPKHEGHSGFTIVDEPSVGRSGISPMITDTAISTYHPNVILLMIGTNDVNLNIDLTNAPARLATLVDEIITDAPNSLLVVAQLTPTTTDSKNTLVQAYNAAIPAMVQQRAAAGKHVMLVDMYSTFTANANYKTALMNDELHPSPTGYGVMGDTWYSAIASFLR